MSTPINIIFEDQTFVIFDKPSGMLVIPSPKQEKWTMIDLVNEQYPQAEMRQCPSPGVRLHPCHRLDRDTSGLIMFAKGKKNQQAMMNEFQAGKVHKKYVAFVRGKLPRENGELRSMIRDFHQSKYNKNHKGRLAVTTYHVLESHKGFSVVDVYPKTGRTNQIRIQFSEIEHPLLGEGVYAFRKDFPVNFRRLALHASELKFPHPVTKQVVVVRCPLAKDMENFLEKV